MKWYWWAGIAVAVLVGLFDWLLIMGASENRQPKDNLRQREKEGKLNEPD